MKSKKSKENAEVKNENLEVKNEKQNKFISGLNKCRTSFQNQMENLKNGGAALVWTVILTFLVMIIICLLVFFASVQGAEKVMVPNVVGKTLTNALFEMQEKELYPKIQLRYSDEIGDAGQIIEQDPVAGSIVKAYRRVTLTVSRGVAVEQIDDYIGQNFDEISQTLNKEFNNEFSLIKLAKPSYKIDDSPKGTILMQYPDPGTEIYDPATLYFIVSNGTEIPLVKVPNLLGNSIKSVLAKMSQTNITFDFSATEAQNSSQNDSVISMENADEEIAEFSRVKVNFAFSTKKSDNENLSGIFSYELPEYPLPVSVELQAKDSEGKITSLVKFNHPGKELTIPYEVKKGSILSLYVLDEKIVDELVQ